MAAGNNDSTAVTRQHKQLNKMYSSMYPAQQIVTTKINNCDIPYISNRITQIIFIGDDCRSQSTNIPIITQMIAQ
jgi:hypothetical protein